MSNHHWITKPFFLLLSIFLVSCSNASIGIQNSQLKPCPASPNCVSTDATDAAQLIAPFKINASVGVFWDELQQQVSSLKKTQIITVNSDYMHAECRSSVFGFVDDLEFLLQPKRGVVAIRSAARLGYLDMGVNRKRIESLREKLTGKGLIE